MKYILNSPIITNFGYWLYRGPLSLGEAMEFFSGEPVISAVGHVATAEVIQALLGIPVECVRRQIKMEVGDSALVFQLMERLPEGMVLSAEELSRMKFTFGILECV